MVIAATREFFARLVELEIRRRLVRERRRNVREMDLSHKVEIRCANFRQASLREAGVLAMYLSDYTLNLLVPKFEKELTLAPEL